MGRETIIDNILKNWRTNKAVKFLNKNDTICDLGCGYDGIFLKNIKNGIKRGIGVDNKVCKKNNESAIKLIAADLNKNLPLRSETFDAVTSFAVLEHIENYNKFLKETLRILKKDGILIMTTPDPKAKIIWEILMRAKIIQQSDNIEEHKNYFHGDKIVEILKNIGFSEVVLKKFQFGFNNLFIAKK